MPYESDARLIGRTEPYRLDLAPDLWGFSNYGVGRVVTGHYPQDREPTVDHNGTLLLLDSNAAGLPMLDGRPRTSFVSLARLPPAGRLDAAELVLVDASLNRW